MRLPEERVGAIPSVPSEIYMHMLIYTLFSVRRTEIYS